MGQNGEVIIDQAHRGYSVATDANGYAAANPLFMKYTPNADGYFAGQNGYGYRSISAFVDAVQSIQSGATTPSDYDGRLATIGTTQIMTAILEAGRRSLDNGGRACEIKYEGGEQPVFLGII